ncbi:hypothetical protein D3C80_1764150 [compost metagenome]
MLLDFAQQIQIVRKRQIRIRSALHQNFCATNIDCLLNFAQYRLIGENIALLRARRPIKSTKTTVYIAYVRVVNVTPHNKGRNRVWMMLQHNLIGHMTHFLNLIRSEQFHAFL